MYHKDLLRLIRKHLDKEETDQFCLWAFGEGYKDFKSTEAFMVVWNKLHWMDLELSPIGVPGHDIVNMIKIWRGK